MNISSECQIGQLTLGELIVTVTEAALEVTQDRDQAYKIASLVLVELLRSAAPGAAAHLLAAYGDTPIQ